MPTSRRRLSEALQRSLGRAAPDDPHGAADRKQTKAERAAARERRLQHVIDALRVGAVGLDGPKSA